MKRTWALALLAIGAPGCQHAVSQTAPTSLRTASTYPNVAGQSGPTPPLPANYRPGSDLTFEAGVPTPVEANGQWTSVMIDAPPQDSQPWKEGFAVMKRHFSDPSGKDGGITLDLEASEGFNGFHFGLTTSAKAVTGMHIGFPTVGGDWAEDEPEIGRLYAQKLGSYKFEVKISEMQTQIVSSELFNSRKFKRVWLRFRMSKF